MSTASADVVRGVFDAAARGDKEAMFGLLRPGVEWQLIGLLPDQASFYRGREEVWAYTLSMAAQIEEMTTELTEVTEIDEHVVARVHLSGRGQESGQPVNLEFSMLVKLEEGRIARADDYEDHEEALTDAELRRGS